MSMGAVRALHALLPPMAARYVLCCTHKLNKLGERASGPELYNCAYNHDLIKDMIRHKYVPNSYLSTEPKKCPYIRQVDS